MTTQSDPSASDPQGIGNAFVKQYYTVLHDDPSQAYRFYLDLSVLTRPCPDGETKSVTTMKEIDELIISLDYQSYKIEISSADAQSSSSNGVIVLVTGSIGKDDVWRKFTQTFFLASQERGYYVLNDLFRYVDDIQTVDVVYNEVDESSQAALSEDPEVTPVPNNAVADHLTAPSDKDENSVKEVAHQLDNGKLSVPEKEVVSEQKLPPPADKTQNDSRPVNQTTTPVIQDDAPKKSYLSIVHALTKNSAPFISKASPPKAKPIVQPRKTTILEESATNNNKTFERNNESSGKNTSIFVANLPMIATEEMLKEVFEKFGPIKFNGIQVRSFKDNRNCFGFVEFESATSVQSAVAASPITIGNRQANIEEKRGSNNGYRNDNFRGGRGNFNGGRNFRRNERNEFSGQARGGAGRNGETNKNVYQNGGKRVAAARPESEI